MGQTVIYKICFLCDYFRTNIAWWPGTNKRPPPPTQMEAQVCFLPQMKLSSLTLLKSDCFHLL